MRWPVRNWPGRCMCAPRSPERARAGAVGVAAARSAGSPGRPASPGGTGREPGGRCRAPVGDQLARQRQGRDAAVVEHRPWTRPLAPWPRPRPCERLGDRVGQRLLAQHVLACFQRGDGDLGVAVARRADVDDVDVVAGRPPPASRLPRPASRTVGRRGGAPSSVRTAADRGQFEAGGQVEERGPRSATPASAPRP